MLPHRRVYDEDHNQFRETVRRFAASKIAPDFQRWEEAGIIDRSLLNAGGAAGLLCPQVPEEFGGAGGDFRHNAVIIEELSYSGFAGPATDFSVHNDVCCGYLLSYGSPEQKKKWLPRMVSGETICAIAMTEPGTGSDLQGVRTRAVREGDDYVISGQKTFITNGQMCDLVIVVVRTSPTDRVFAVAGTSKSLGISPPIRPNCSSTAYASPSAICWERKAARWAP
jgi:acyl-CoA dehydrogenase